MSVVAQKIKSARFNVGAYPHLQNLIAHIDEAAASAIASTCRMSELERSIDVQMSDAGGDIENSVSYFLRSADGKDVAIAALSPRFLMALSESMLGANFAMPEEASPSALDINLGESFIGELANSLNGWLAEHSSARMKDRLTLSAVENDPKDIRKALPQSAFFQVVVHIKPEPEKAVYALSFLFPVSFLENRGLMAQGRAQKPEAVNAEWRAKMADHINASEIDIDVIMDRYTAFLSDVAMLEIGQVIPLDGEAHKTLELYLNTETGPVMIGKGRLGAYKKKKAVKLTTDLGAECAVAAD